MGGLRRAPLAALAVAALLPASLVRADGARGGEPVVRVLLHAGEDAVQVGEARYRPGPGGKLLRNGRPTATRIALPGPIRVGKGRYRGRVVVTRSDGGLHVVNELPLERYLEGTLLKEVYPGWDAAVLQAQAVVARSYALHRGEQGREGMWDLTSGTASQVYGGMDAEAEEAARAVADTRGEVLVWEGRPILAAYHSASGGRTASAEEVWGQPVPYLVSVRVDGEEVSPDTYWRIPVSAANLGRALAGLGWPVGRVREVRVVERSPSGRVKRAEVRGTRSAATVSGRDLRRAAGRLPSTMFEVRGDDGEFLFVGSGYGHGVGMSQWGARAMAQRGADYREILAWFYPGARLRGDWGFGEEL